MLGLILASSQCTKYMPGHIRTLKTLEGKGPRLLRRDQVRVCSQPDLTQPAGLGRFLGLGGLGWVYKKKFNSRLGWVQVIKFQTRQNPTRPDPPIYLKYII